MQIEIIYSGVPLLVDGTYEKGSAQIMYDTNGEGYPENPSEFEISKITVSDSEIDIFELFLSREIQEIEELIIEKIEE